MLHHHPIPRDVLGCIVTGYAKGGTTLVKDLIVNTTVMTSGFEGGLLLADAPRDGIPEPFATNLLESWRLPTSFLDRYRECGSFEAGYRLLRKSSKKLKRHDAPLIDKAPQYLMQLDDVMRRAPGTPVVVVIRDPLHVAVSWLELGNSLGDTVAWLRFATEALAATIKSADFAASLFVINFGELLQEVDATMALLHAWLGFPHVPMPVDKDARYGLHYVRSGREEKPRCIEVDRHDMASRCSPEILDRIRYELAEAIPEADRIFGLPTGPVSGRTLLGL